MESFDGSFKPALISGCTNMTVSRNDLPIKDQNFKILCMEVIYSMKPVPNVKMLANYCHFQISLCLYNGGTHTLN